MIDRQTELEEEIARQCGEGGFLIQVAALATFDEDNYRRLVTALKEYDEVLGDSPVLDRYVAGCLLDLEVMLPNAIAKMLDVGLPLADRVTDAYAVISDLVHTIMTPPSMRGSRKAIDTLE